MRSNRPGRCLAGGWKEWAFRTGKGVPERTAEHGQRSERRGERNPGGPRSRLFDGVSEGLRVAAHPIVPGDDGDQLRRLADLARRGQVNRIERADRLDGIGTARAHENGFGDVHDVATAPKSAEPSKGGALFLRAEPTAIARAHETPRGLGESQGRGDASPFTGHCALGSRILLEEGRKQRTRLDVSERYALLHTALGRCAANAPG